MSNYCQVSKLLLRLAVLFVGIAFAFSAAAGIEERMLQSTVRIFCINGAKVGSGTGFLIGASDHIATNWHVVDCSDKEGELFVFLSGSQDKLTAKVRWSSSKKDLAILKLSEIAMRPAVSFASRKTVKLLDVVIASGFPGAADDMADQDSMTAPSLTRGRVSRAVSNHGVNYYQIDAALNPGNSGGPLFNEWGELIGINAQKSLATVATIGGGDKLIDMQRVTKGEGIGLAIQAEELIDALKDIGIMYQLNTSRPNLLQGLWQRQPIIFALMAVLLSLSLIGIGLASTKRGREVVIEAAHTYSRRLTGSHAETDKPKKQKGKAVLRGISGPWAASTLEIGDGEVAIGRDPRLSQVVMPADASVIGKRHCTLRFDPNQGNFILEDCWSSNGTFLAGGEQVPQGQSRKLNPGEQFYLADKQYQFQVDVERSS